MIAPCETVEEPLIRYLFRAGWIPAERPQRDAVRTAMSRPNAITVPTIRVPQPTIETDPERARGRPSGVRRAPRRPGDGWGGSRRPPRRTPPDPPGRPAGRAGAPGWPRRR